MRVACACGRGKEEGTRLPLKQLLGRSSGICAFWTWELFYLGVISEERMVTWHSGGVGHVLSYVVPYLILPAPTLHAAVALCCEGGRQLQGIVNYMLE